VGRRTWREKPMHLNLGVTSRNIISIMLMPVYPRKVLQCPSHWRLKVDTLKL
jgi:hypothetical protein